MIEAEPAERRTLARVRELLADPLPKLNTLLETILESPAADGLAGDAAKLLLSLGGDERGSMMSTVSNHLQFLRFPQAVDALAHSDFDLGGLLRDELDLFLVVPDELIVEQSPLLRLFVSMTLALVSRSTPTRRILLILDEMGVVGRLEPIIRAFSIAAGKGVSIFGFSQSLHDLYGRYGESMGKSMVANAELVMFFEVPPGDPDLAEQVSKLVGEFTERETSTGTNTGVGGTGMGSVSAGMNQSERLAKARVITADEVREMRFGDAIAVTRSRDVPRRPIWLQIPRYWERGDMKRLVDANPLRQ